ncbi:hypothetical protein SEA_SONALI_95 [Arthrobacter phage Sonali]|uniref:Uncharacterized protein n=1 Tax=Arthrobacter phage Sonali TaxID=2510495 RepID=A0A411CQX2_9CAUD|nr:hypothetical protein HOV09_gp95 [Arthrobacter phage Sonali]QAY16207.1 hypothetical protein SEA_SONALI_95 [Arthrobacter phage Sonali]
MEQLSIKVQANLVEVGFAAAITPTQDVEFRHDTEERAITVLAIRDEVHITVKGRNKLARNVYKAAELEACDDATLEMWLTAIRDFA